MRFGFNAMLLIGLACAGHSSGCARKPLALAESESVQPSIVVRLMASSETGECRAEKKIVLRIITHYRNYLEIRELTTRRDVYTYGAAAVCETMYREVLSRYQASKAGTVVGKMKAGGLHVEPYSLPVKQSALTLAWPEFLLQLKGYRIIKKPFCVVVLEEVHGEPVEIVIRESALEPRYPVGKDAEHRLNGLGPTDIEFIQNLVTDGEKLPLESICAIAQ